MDIRFMSQIRREKVLSGFFNNLQEEDFYGSTERRPEKTLPTFPAPITGECYGHVDLYTDRCDRDRKRRRTGCTCRTEYYHAASVYSDGDGDFVWCGRLRPDERAQRNW